MGGLLTIVVSNTVVAGGIAFFAVALTKAWKNPHVAHMLWLLVLLKLVTPPIVQIPLPTVARDVTVRPTVSTDRPTSQQADEISATPAEPVEVALEPAAATFMARESEEPGVASRVQRAASQWPYWLLALWAGGILVTVSVAWRRHARLMRVLAEARSPDDSLIADMATIAQKLGLSTCPRLLLTPARIPPLVTCGIRKPAVLLPIELIDGMERHQVRSILAHEAAHLKRRDHWVRLFELSVLAVYWWNPLAWWASRRAGRAEEECCDAWVVWAFPERRRAYGQALFQTLQYLTEKRPVVTSFAATMGRFLLHGRIETMLNGRIDRRVSKAALSVILLIGATALPLAMKPAYSSDGGTDRNGITPDVAVEHYENYLKTIQSVSLHSVFKDRDSEKSEVFTNSLSQDHWIDFKGKRLRFVVRRLDPDNGKVVVGPREKVCEVLITPSKLYDIVADPDTFTAEGIVTYRTVLDEHRKQHWRLLYLSYPFGYFQDGKQERYIPKMFENMSVEEDGSSKVVLACKTKDYELNIRLDRSKGWMPDRIEYSRKKPGENPCRPNYFLYTVDHASNHNGVWFPDAFRCTVSNPGGKVKLAPHLRMVDGAIVIVRKASSAGRPLPGVGFREYEKSTVIAEVAVSDIRIGRLTDSDFELKTTVPDGMTVHPQDDWQSTFKWRNGTVVRED